MQDEESRSIADIAPKDTAREVRKKALWEKIALRGLTDIEYDDKAYPNPLQINNIVLGIETIDNDSKDDMESLMNRMFGEQACGTINDLNDKVDLPPEISCFGISSGSRRPFSADQVNHIIAHSKLLIQQLKHKKIEYK